MQRNQRQIDPIVPSRDETANTGSQVINNSIPAGTGYVNLSIPGLSPSGLLGISLQLSLTGAGVLYLDPFSKVALDDMGIDGQELAVGFTDRSVEVDDTEIRLATGLSDANP